MGVFVQSVTFLLVASAASAFMAGSVACQTKTQTDRERAEKTWEALVKEKGGRARLHRITTILTTLVGKKPEEVRLDVPPTKLWKYGYSLVGVPSVYRSDSSIPLGEYANPDGTINSYKNDDAFWLSLQRVIYLLETRFEKPVPLRVVRQRIGKITYDVLETSFGDQRVDFYFEPEEMLVSRVVRFNTSLKVSRTYVFSDYTEIDGIKMPQWQGDEKHSKIYGLRFAFNVDYDPAIFTGPLKVTTIDGWKRKP